MLAHNANPLIIKTNTLVSNLPNLNIDHNKTGINR